MLLASRLPRFHDHRVGSFPPGNIHINAFQPFECALLHGYRARAAFNLTEILDTEKLLRRGDVVVDLGAAPGSWSQVLRASSMSFLVAQGVKR